MIDVLPPPAIYDHEYPGQLTVETGTPAEVTRRCVAMGVSLWRQSAYGCSQHNNYQCTIVISRVNGWWISQQDQEELVRHEIAHCNGWPPNHSAP